MNHIQSIATRQESTGKYACCSMRENDAKMTTSIFINNKLLFQVDVDYIVADEDGIDINCSYCFELSLRIILRKSDDIIVWMPDFQYDWNTYLFERGVLYMSCEVYQQIRQLIPEIPVYESIVLLIKQDCANILWFEAPDAIKSYRKFEFDKKAYLNTDATEGLEVLKILETVLKAYAESGDVACLKFLTDNEITIFLDTPEYIEWKPLYTFNGTCFLRLNPGYRVV